MCASAPPFSARGRGRDFFRKPASTFRHNALEMNDNSRLRREPPHQSLQVAARKCDTARRRAKTRPRDMNEHSAAMASNARARVMVDFDDEIVKPIGTLEAVAWFIGRPPERPVVAPVRGVFAPGIVRRDSPDRQERRGMRQAVCPPPQPNRMKSSGRRGAIAFAFRRLDAGPAQSRTNRALPRHEPGLHVQPRADVHMNCGQRGSAHRAASAFCREFCHEPPRSSQTQLFQPKLTIVLTFCVLTFCGRMIFSENWFPLFPDHALVLATLVLAPEAARQSGG